MAFTPEEEERIKKLEERLPMTTKQAEELLGTLIRALNPYTDIMHYPPGDPILPAQPDPDLKNLEAAAIPAVHKKLAQYKFEVDNRYGSQNGGDYLSWEFKREPQIIKKAVRIEFRHPSEKGGWITDHLLIGFAGSNGP